MHDADDNLTSCPLWWYFPKSGEEEYSFAFFATIKVGKQDIPQKTQRNHTHTPAYREKILKKAPLAVKII